jgi:hypothetical protein
MRCLARNPAYRPASAAELERELAPASAEPPTERLVAPREPSRRLLWVGAAGAAALAAILLAVTLTGGHSRQKQPPPRPRAVPQIPRGADAQQQARNLADWLRRYSTR